MRNDELSVQSMDFAVQIINLVKDLKSKHETVISNQIGRSGTSIGANVREAESAQSKADFVSKMAIALKECGETSYWLELLVRTEYISQKEFSSIIKDCEELFALLTAIVKTSRGER